MKLKLGIQAYSFNLYRNYDFYSGKIRTLVAMANYISHRLIMVKVKVDIFFCLNGGYLEFIFTEMFIV